MKNYEFNALKAADDCVQWIRRFFKENGEGCNAVLGISGGKDSSVAAALLVKALGKERVIGVLMPAGVQPDIEYSHEICAFLGIKKYLVDVGPAIEAVKKELSPQMPLLRMTTVNLPPRIRMATLYAVSQSNNGRVANTCNLSEDWVGYSTRYGDGAGDFSPLGKLTVTEVKAIGRALGLPEKFISKPPSDGLTGLTDEDNLGFTYADLDKYIRTGECELSVKEKIDALYKKNKFKTRLMPAFDPHIPLAEKLFK